MPKKTHSYITMVEPAVETLFAWRDTNLWPAKVRDNPDLMLYVEIRLALQKALDALFQSVPDATEEISDAIKSGRISEDAATKLYDQLALFLNIEPLHRRLVLYLPFEILPSRDRHHASESLRAAQKLFLDAYMRCWRELLDEVDVRANFFDGNILEKELAPDGQPRVVKAAHLIPQLLKKGIISKDEVAEHRDLGSTILKQSIDDAFPESVTGVRVEKNPEVFDNARLLNLPEEIAGELRKLDMREAHDYAQALPPARVAWERKSNEDVLVTTYANKIARSLTAHLSIEYVVPFTGREHALAVRLSALRAIGIAVEQMKRGRKGLEWAQDVSGAFLNRFERNMVDSPEISDELEGILARWTYLGITAKQDLKKFGFELPKLDAGFSKKSRFAADVEHYWSIIATMRQDGELAQLFYPVALFFGSGLKRYAKRNADIDVAVLIRPGVAKNKRKKIRRILGELFSDKKVGGKVVEFWLEKDEDDLKIRDFANPDVFLADSTWVHLLLQSVWLGEDDAIRELYAKLLPGFLNLKGKQFEGRDVRKLCLDEMEREVLQYRLMHKGYQRFFPPVGGIDASAKNLDPASMFWDSGYRRLATKLYVGRVFLPQIHVKDV
jgi:hypothetical protein